MSATAVQNTPDKARLIARLRTLAPVLVLVFLCLLIGALNPQFFAIGNFVRILTSAAIPLVLALGVTFVIVIGSIDLSVEGSIALSVIALAMLVADNAGGPDLGLWAVPLVIGVGAAMGLLNGMLHVGLQIPSFMVTLGTLFMGLGLGTVMLGGGTIRIVDPNIRGLSLIRLADLPLMVWLSVLCLGMAWVIQSYTRFGRHMFAIGGGEDIAALSGVAIGRTKILVFGLAGVFYGIAAIMAAAQLGQGNATIGDGRLFSTITAVVVGGTSLAGGTGGVLNSLVGVLIVAVLANGMVMLGIPPYVQQAVQGVMIIVSVAITLEHSKFRIVK